MYVYLWIWCGTWNSNIKRTLQIIDSCANYSLLLCLCSVIRRDVTATLATCATGWGGSRQGNHQARPLFWCTANADANLGAKATAATASATDACQVGKNFARLQIFQPSTTLKVFVNFCLLSSELEFCLEFFSIFWQKWKSNLRLTFPILIFQTCRYFWSKVIVIYQKWKFVAPIMQIEEFKII